MTHPQPWARRGVCAQTDPELFTSEDRVEIRQALAVCQVCPVRQRCLDWALAQPENPWGVYGATTQWGRKGILRKRRREAATPPAATPIAA